MGIKTDNLNRQTLQAALAYLEMLKALARTGSLPADLTVKLSAMREDDLELVAGPLAEEMRIAVQNEVNNWWENTQVLRVPGTGIDPVEEATYRTT